ncbi:hypothetical protein R1flu_029039 [Riccia fluitans]|uniref:Uncharacterized protein n=1 Tax=Riccia fluitans TaxID=41844 RepID=A0ABD1XRD6_9MARC
MYEQTMQILAETAHLENCMGLNYTDLNLEVSLQFQSREEWMRTFKEESKKITLVAKEALAVVATATTVQKASEKRIDELLQHIDDMAVQQVIKIQAFKSR